MQLLQWAGFLMFCGELLAADEFGVARERMVREQIEARGVRSSAVLDAIRATPRHLFLPPGIQDSAYRDRAIPIGYGQTMSQPYVVALMTELLDVRKMDRVLEIGTGSGYQAAVLARLAKEVYTIEIVPELAAESATSFRRLNYANIFPRHGDGYRGWPEKAPFDRILLTAAPPEIPTELIGQLAAHGKLVAPEGLRDQQRIVVVEKLADGSVVRKPGIPVRFVPMVREPARSPKP
ncbi:MAG: protein-L-isoaspartate(D-aspartate) O-methyltransferase [Bryobacteraceae bacterium]